MDPSTATPPLTPELPSGAMGLLLKRPALAEVIRRDVAAGGGPDGVITRCSLVFDRWDDQAWVCYEVEIADDPTAYGSWIEVTDEDYAAALAMGLDAETLGF